MSLININIFVTHRVSLVIRRLSLSLIAYQREPGLTFVFFTPNILNAQNNKITSIITKCCDNFCWIQVEFKIYFIN